MLFVTQLKVLPGQWEDATRLFKHPKIPNNVMVHEFLGLLGKPDAIVIFEAVDAATAADFMVQFSRVTDATTSLALPIEEFKWTWCGGESPPGDSSQSRRDRFTEAGGRDGLLLRASPEESDAAKKATMVATRNTMTTKGAMNHPGPPPHV